MINKSRIFKTKNYIVVCKENTNGKRSETMFLNYKRLNKLELLRFFSNDNNTGKHLLPCLHTSLSLGTALTIGHAKFTL